MWIHVRFRDDVLAVVAEHGTYDEMTADLSTRDTKVYEAHLGPDAAVAAATGLPERPSFHFVLNNKYYKDNRIPPRGFTNAAFAGVQAAPVGAVYADGQFWDDTPFHIPPGATSAVVSLYYQTAAKEYITFLRDENHTNEAGHELYRVWESTGMSPPVLMQQAVIVDLVPGWDGDVDCDDDVDLDDYSLIDGCLTGTTNTLLLGCEAWDLDTNNRIDLFDVAGFLNEFTGGP